MQNCQTSLYTMQVKYGCRVNSHSRDKLQNTCQPMPKIASLQVSLEALNLPNDPHWPVTMLLMPKVVGWPISGNLRISGPG